MLDGIVGLVVDFVVDMVGSVVVEAVGELFAGLRPRLRRRAAAERVSLAKPRR